MPNHPYSDYLEVNPLFESVLDIQADQRNPALWREYIVGREMEELVEKLCLSLGNETVDARRSFWIHGSYGTGKSYAAIFVKHLLEENPDVIDEFLGRNALSQYRNRFMKNRRRGEYLVIWKTGCTDTRTGSDMLLGMEIAIREALSQKFGDNAVMGGASLLQAVREKLRDESINWPYVLDNTTLGEDYDSIENLRLEVENGNLEAIQRTADVIRRQGWGLVNTLETFKAWITEIINANNLRKSGIFFIWDEFTEYVEHGDDHTIMQQISEFTKEQPFFAFYVVHRSEEMMDSMGKDRYQLITNRFHTVAFHINQDAAFDLIAGSFVTRPNVDEYWKEARHHVVGRIRKILPDMAGLNDRISENIDKFCPMHPMTIRLLSRVAESYAAAQRTLFRFMKDQTVQDQGFVGYINKYGPDDECCWLTPEWLWDYFFTRDSDFADKDTKAAEFIRHFEENRELVERDENTFRVFKVSLLLLMVMSSTQGVYGGRRTRDGISATVECLETCLAGTMDKTLIRDKLDILEDNGLINRDQHGDVVRLQLPFRSLAGDDFNERYKKNDKEFSRYQMFKKDGIFSIEFEKRVLDENDAMSRRIKAAVCCAETQSIHTRLKEVEEDLKKAPYKLGLLLVTVRDDLQAVSVEEELKQAAMETDERICIALLRTPFSEDKRKEWLTRLTKREQASEAGSTSSANQFKVEMDNILSAWISDAVSSGKMTLWHGAQVYTNRYGMMHLRKTIRTGIFQILFPYAPENLVATSTAYKTCNDSAPLAGIRREANSAQPRSVLQALQKAEVLNAATIKEIAAKQGDRGITALAELAHLVYDRMSSGKVALADLWDTLRQKPFGYYDTIVCGVLLGFMFSFYKDSAYSWTDSAQSTHVLGESTLKTMVYNLCKGKMDTDYLSEGSAIFRKFREFAKSIFSLNDVQTANETECWRNIREVITKSGAPLWSLKYLPDEKYLNPSLKAAAHEIVDTLQIFVLTERDQSRENVMSDFLQQINGRGKVKKLLGEAMGQKTVLALAFRNFLFASCPALKEIAEKLSLQAELLDTKLTRVMQGAIYTWTEEQVAAKLPEVALEYRYLDIVNTQIGKNCHSIEDAQKELRNLFHFFRISIEAVEMLAPPWYNAFWILKQFSPAELRNKSSQEMEQEISVLRQHGREAIGALRDAKPLVRQILEQGGFQCTDAELDSIYQGLRDITSDTSLFQFGQALKQQSTKISQIRNRNILRERWTTRTGEESVKSWCVTHKAPLQWILPREQARAVETIRQIQSDFPVANQQVEIALTLLPQIDLLLLTDDNQIQAALLETIGLEYKEIWQEQQSILLSRARQSLGADLSRWDASDLGKLQRLLKEAMREKAKREKLENAKHAVQQMDVSVLRGRLTDFLNQHPEFCDSFLE